MAKEKAVLTESDKKIRNIAAVVCIALIAIIAVLYVTVGFGKNYLTVAYEKGGETYIYESKKGNITKRNKNPEFEKYDYVKEYADGKALLFNSAGDEFDVTYFDSKELKPIGKYKNAELTGKFAIVEKSDGLYFTDFKKEQYIGVDGELKFAKLSFDERYVLLIYGEDNKLGSFRVDITENKIASGTELVSNVDDATFNGRKNDIGFIDNKNVFHYYSAGYSYEEDENVYSMTTGDDTASIFYCKDENTVVKFSQGSKKDFYVENDGSIKEICYLGSDALGIIVEENGVNNLYKIDGGKKIFVDSDVNHFVKGY